MGAALPAALQKPCLCLLAPDMRCHPRKGMVFFKEMWQCHVQLICQWKNIYMQLPAGAKGWHIQDAQPLFSEGAVLRRGQLG